MKQDRLQRAKERFTDSMDSMREQNERMREDLRFSNPVDPQQWSDEAKSLRGARPMLIFDNCNKYIFQVVNDGNASPPSIQTAPADGFGHAKAAEVFNGRIRHIEYVSRAQIAYGTGLDLAARCGLGWLRVVPEILNPETNQQEPRILRIKSPFECVLDDQWQEPDGSDTQWGFVLQQMRRKAFKTAYPKANASHGWNDEGRLWSTADTVTVAEYFEFETKRVNKIMILTPDGEQIALTEDEYWQVANQIGFKPEVVSNFMHEDRTVIWSKMTGCEEIEETVFPSKFIPIVPIVGNELWIDGKRYLGGLTRQLMDGQRMHNAEMSSYTEAILSQPKAPFMVPMRAVEGHEVAWQKLNSGNPTFLPYNDIDESNPTHPSIPAPSRMSPPAFPSAFAQGAVMGTNAMSNAIGVYKSGLGQETANAISGVAKQQDRRESNTATFHYQANRVISLQHVGRILIDMERRLTDTARNVRIMSEDGKSSQVRYEPDMPEAVQMRGSEVVAINPKLGEYDLRVKVGPSFLTQNEETASELGDMFRGAPELLPVLGPLWAQLKGVPNVEMVKKLLIALAPEKVQAIYAEEEKEQAMPPQAMAAIQQRDQKIQELSHALENAAAEADKTGVEKEKAKIERDKADADMLIRGYSAVTERLKIAPPMTPEGIQALVMQTLRDAMTVPPIDPDAMQEEQAEQGQMQPQAEPMPQLGGDEVPQPEGEAPAFEES